MTVEDTGPGVSAWAREHLFEPFFTTKPAGKGTGLGLAISYQIVQRHGGRIELDDAYRSGARFVVSLPVAANDSQSREMSDRALGPGGGNVRRTEGLSRGGTGQHGVHTSIDGNAAGRGAHAWAGRVGDRRDDGTAGPSLDDSWTAECIVRERAGFVLTCILGLLIVPAWGVFDAVLEPALLRRFLWLRLVDFVVGNGLFFILLRSKDLRRVRLIGASRLLLAGTIIALMCVRVSTPHYFPYVLGFSLIFWAIALVQSWPVAYGVALCGSLLGAYFLGRFLIGVPRPTGDEVAALFYLGATTAWCIVSIESRRRLHYRTFLANFQLAVRNKELDATVRALRETQARLVETEKLSALGRLIASLSHEINNPVNVLRNNLEPLRGYLRQISEALLVMRAGGDFERAWVRNDLDFVLDDTVGAVETMGEGVDRIQAVHSEMRAFVRGDAPEMQAGDLNEGLRATVNMFRRSLPRDVPIEIQCGRLPATRFQPGQMNQVFFNLIQNAVDAIEARGQAGDHRGADGRRG